MNDQEDQILKNIFFPSESAVRESEMNSRFVHYTSSENGLKIIRGGELWLRNSLCMNDYMEIEYGSSIISRFFEENRSLLENYLGYIDDNSHEIVYEIFVNSLRIAKSGTYISCMSEHNSTEDQYGRLSMWRAYGGLSNGVAIVLNRWPFFKDNYLPGGTFIAPVVYFCESEMSDYLNKFINSINKNRESLKNVKREKLIYEMGKFFVNLSISSKHPVFKEEKEWRIYCIPNVHPSILCSNSTEIIYGVPQDVWKIKILKNSNNCSFSFKCLVDRIIVGPSKCQETIRQSFIKELENSGVDDAETRVVVSNIPIRV